MDDNEFTAMFGKKLLFRPGEVAEMFSMSKSQISEMIETSTLLVVRDDNGQKVTPIRILRKSIIRYLEHSPARK